MGLHVEVTCYGTVTCYTLLNNTNGFPPEIINSQILFYGQIWF